MKNLIAKAILAAAVLITGSVANSQNKIDYWLENIVEAYKQKPAQTPRNLQRLAGVETAPGQPMVNVILQTEDGELSFVKQHGGAIGTIAGSITTARIPIDAIEPIASLANVTYVSGSIRLQELNDFATQAIGSRAAIAAGYTGDDVLIGVIDSGIDLMHPGFRNAAGTRILYLWDQSITGAGPKNPLYNYGVEWSKEQIDQGIATSTDTDGHGTHVAGSIAQHIATGPDSTYDGSVVAANLIIVKSNFFSHEILDGINYIFEKARQLGKPAIVNISLGSQQGPHDGLDPFTAAQDFLTGPGRIIVQAAGNDSEGHIHHMVTADTDGEDMEFNLAKTASVLEFELWYDGATNASIQILAPGGVIFPAIAAGTPTTVIDSPSGKATVDNASNGSEYYNGDKRICITLENALAGGWTFRLSASPSTAVHAWMWNGDFESEFQFNTNDDHYTLVNEACARTNIVVGATVTRNRFQVRDFPGVPDGTEFVTSEIMGELASFTSGGPTRDGREKPDLVAPGTMIASAESDDIERGTGTLSENFRSIGPRYPAFGLQYIQFMQGTSMSAPVAGGGIAQMLKRRPKIDHSAVKSYAKRFSTSVGSASAGVWDYRAGNGMINMQALIDNEIQVTAAAQASGNMIILTFSKPPNGTDNPSNYTIIGPSSLRRVIRAEVENEVVTLTLDGDLVEGERDILKIENVSAIADMEAFADAIEVEIDKIGTIIAPHHVLTNEIWRAEESPYYIHGEVQVPTFVRLTIEPGTMIKFMPNAKDSSQLVILGELIAQGAENEPIVFTSLHESRNGEWEGLYFDSDIPPTTLKFCEIRYADYGIFNLSDDLAIEDCKIFHSLNVGILVRNSSPAIWRTIIWDSNGGEFDDGIQLINATSSTLIENATIHGNGRVGIVCFASNPQIVNCIISDNSGPGVHSQDGAPPTVTYSDVSGNSPNYSGVNAGTGSISANPMYMNANQGDFRLSANSPCIDAGNPEAIFSDPDGTRNDMGALPRITSLVAFDARPTDQGIELTWTTVQTDRVKGIMILRNIDEAVQANPANGNSYAVGTELGNAMVIYSMVGGNDPGRHIDTDIQKLTTYHYAGWSIYSDQIYSAAPLHATTTTTAVTRRDESRDIPISYDLRQNYPNPFNPYTTIAFDLPKTSEIKLRVYDVLGQIVRTLVDEWRPAGRYSISWDGKGKFGRSVASGTYVVRMRADNFEKSVKLTLVK